MFLAKDIFVSYATECVFVCFIICLTTHMCECVDGGED